jgi:acetyl esterase/lipase
MTILCGRNAQGHSGGPALVWVHGGAFVGGDLEMPEATWVALAIAAAGIPVLSVDDRKCLGGTHFPAPSDDVLAAWLWGVEHADDELGTSPQQLHLGGASAGGTLTSGVAKRLRDGAGPPPASLVLVYPALHAEAQPMSEEVAAAVARATFSIPDDAARMLSLNYAGSEAMLTDPVAFPGNGDAAGLPPFLIVNAECDTLRASGDAFAETLRSADVDVELVTELDTEHGYLNVPGDTGALRTIGRMISWLSAH